MYLCEAIGEMFAEPSPIRPTFLTLSIASTNTNRLHKEGESRGRLEKTSFGGS